MRVQKMIKLEREEKNVFVAETSILNLALIFFFFNFCKVSARQHKTFVCKTFVAAANSMPSQTAHFRCLLSHDEQLQFTGGGGGRRLLLTATSQELMVIIDANGMNVLD